MLSAIPTSAAKTRDSPRPQKGPWGLSVQHSVAMTAALCCPPLPRAGRSPLLPFLPQSKEAPGEPGPSGPYDGHREPLDPRTGTPSQTSFSAANCLLALWQTTLRRGGDGAPAWVPHPAWNPETLKGRVPYPLLTSSP